MGENKGLFIVILLVMFVLFLSWISIVFNLEGGNFFKFELALLIIMLLWAVKSTAGVLAGSNKWKSMIAFYMIVWVNLIAIYFTRFGIKELLLPFLVTGIGFLVAIIKDDSSEIEAVEEKKVKYIASKKGKQYHVPECEQAKKIKNKVEFDSMEDAAAKGLKAHECVNQ
jgi:hypothetical protein